MKLWVNIFSLIFLFWSLAIFTGCTKDENILPPSISFSLPVENDIFNIPDSIHVVASISSESSLEILELRIVNSNFIPVTETTNIPVSGSSHGLDELIIADDIYLESGTYFIEIAATASGETKRKYREITLNEYPLLFERVCVFTIDGNFSLIDIFSDSLEVGSYSLSGELSKGIINNYNRQVVLGNSNGLINAFDVETHELIWSETNNNSVSNEFFNDVQFNKELRRVYFSDNNGDIRGYDGNGELVDLVNVGDNLIPESFNIDEDHIVVEVTNFNQSSRFLQVFFRSTGSLLTNLDVDIDIRKILKIDENQYIIIGNGTTKDEVAIYFLDENAFFFPSVFESTGIKDIVRMDEENFAISHSSGIFVFNQSNNDLSLVYEEGNADYIEYDPVNDILMVVANNQLTLVNASISSMLDQYYFSSPIKGIDILYNK